MRISQRSIEQVRETADIVEVASEFTALKRQGTSLVGLCPYPDHSEKTPSFNVMPAKSFYHCFGCLEANERIWTSKGLVPIATAEVGDEVVGLDGRRETITDKWFKSGPTLRIRTGAAKEGIELTPDHHCVFVRREEALRAVSRVHLRYSGKSQIRFSGKPSKENLDAQLFVEQASEVREGDFWLYPVIPNECRDDKPLPGEHLIRPYTSGPRTKRIAGLHVNPDTAYLYGLWLAEGSLYRGGIKWSFGAHEAESLAAKVGPILEEEFGRPSTRFVRPDKNNCEVTCSSTDLAALFGRWFGRGCANKRVPIEALSWSAECQLALVEGYLDGDGCANGGIKTASTASVELAYGIFALCIQAGKVCSLSATPARAGNDGVKRRKTYSIHFPNKESLKGFFARIGDTRYFWSVVREVKTCREEPTTVVDITTTGSHTFLTKMGATHNCQRGGDAIKLVMELKSLPFVEAVSHLAERFGVELKLEGRSQKETEQAEQRAARRRSAHKALAAATAYYHKYLLKSPAAEDARRYLEKRGFEQSTIEEFRLGYAPPRGGAGFARVARGVGLGREALEAAGLLSPRGGERFVDRIMFPISDRRGRIVGFGARALGDAKPKYLNSPETELFNKRSLLYGFPQVEGAMRKERAALVVEGYTDVLMLYQAGIKNAVATLGTAMTEQHLKTLSGHADEIYLLFDPDAAGQKAVEAVDKIVAAAFGFKLDLRVLRLPEDPADWLLKHSAEKFSELLPGAAPVLEYLFHAKAEHLRGASTAERARMLSEIRSMIQRIKDPVFKRDAIRVATEVLNVGPEDLRGEADLSNGRKRSPPDAKPQRTPSDPHVEASRELLALVLARPDLAARPLREGMADPTLPDETVPLRAADFGNESHGLVFSLLAEHAGKGAEAILSDERARPLLDEISALQALGGKLFPSTASLRAAWMRLAALACEKQKSLTEDFDQKYRLHTKARRYAAEASNLTLES